ncbi:hypothetical protein [Aquimixticola soesokkakensis]|uniref:hypothetical protein n=1 Tax=Aquimixticola soesokkakensis TaxID=1519096 RepID=UPI001F2E3A03|nr:hypothetical protein [Aquimixticola soesokkakensis]
MPSNVAQNAPAPAPVFLARRSYRRRRLIDAARLLPVVAGGLFFVPLIWQGAGERAGEVAEKVSGTGGGATGGVTTAWAYVHVFVVWGAVILAAGLLSRALRRSDPQAGSADARDQTGSYSGPERQSRTGSARDTFSSEGT